MSSVATVLMQPHAIILSLGYTLGVPTSAGFVFMQLLLEMGAEFFVDKLAIITGIACANRYSPHTNMSYFPPHSKKKQTATIKPVATFS